MKIKVGLYGMDERCSQRMLTVFKMVYKGQCEAVEVAEADTVIVDLDDKNTEQVLQAFRDQYPDKPMVLMASALIEIPGIPFVAKPARLPELLDALKQTSNKQIGTDLGIQSENRTHKVADSLYQRNNPAAKPAQQRSTSVSDDIFYNPESFLQGKVVSAIRNANIRKETVFIKCWADRWIIASPGVDFLFENIKEEHLQYLGLNNIDNDIVYDKQILSQEQITEMAQTPISEVKSTPINKFLWDVTVRTSRGRVPRGTSLDEHYVLTRWPNLTRLSRIPNSMRISAFWVDQAQSINDIAEKLGIPLADVCTFFSAASVTGILTLAKRDEDRIVKPEPAQVDKKKKGILSAIMQKISKKAHLDEDAA